MSDSMTDAEKKLLEEFEAMLNESDDQDDFGYFNPNFIYPYYPNDDDLEYPDEPPPIPKEALKKDKCDHKETKKVYISNTMAYIMCKACKADLGDAK